MQMIEVNRVSKYFGGLPALKEVSFSAKKQEIVGLIGPNGAGKTTLFNVISGFFQPTSGTVSFAGEKINGIKPNILCRKGISRTFQIVKPFEDITALENVMIGALCRTNNVEEAREKSYRILAEVDMKPKAEQKGKNLTIGDRKRLELARALATDPEVLLLDEVMAGLTPTEVNGIIKLIKDMREKGLSLIVIEHNMSAIMSLSDRVVVLNYGEKIADGKPDEVANDPNVIKAYLGEDIKYA